MLERRLEGPVSWVEVSLSEADIDLYVDGGLPSDTTSMNIEKGSTK